ncbi:hypothetical protein DMN91_008768 [Ooceraea biroi]|uniref:CS domain-containing protein n=1 Tax=Ooceraea biroi TaxID=2015173 RepID=A0A3L8DDL2_OOCBI|nr:nudC domain-containing protein 3 [Ooceraea biroi]RLU18411.1 hypothetical protein DMN91_008768 [Ooceraea biroi]
MESDQDQAFLHILREKKNINNFLNAFFGFLYRCTDFYVESNLEQKLGFPPGVAEELVLNSMHEWKNVASTLQKTTTHMNNITINKSNNISQSIQSNLENLESKNGGVTPPVAYEVEIDSCNKFNNSNPSFTRLSETNYMSDSYNGAIRENYVWTQTLSDLDVLVKIPEHIKCKKNAVRVNISLDEIKIDVKSSDSTKDFEWENIFNGKLSFKIRKDESIWSVSGKHISIHLEKVSERWWEALTADEPKIDLSKIDCTKHFDDMAPDEQIKVQELVWNQQQKLLDKPTSEQIKMEAILKQAWNAKGSPFQGTPYDPSILKYN